MSSPAPPSQSPGAVVLQAHLKKLKTLKKKYFVLRAEASGHPACLEYYDSKKKYDAKHPPKRSISVRSCFNINKRRDTKHKHVIALYTKDDCFCLMLDNERDLDEWLKALLLLQNGDQPDGEQPRPTFEHVWQVQMQKKGLGERKNITGPYRLCLTDRVLSLVRLGSDDKSDSIEFTVSIALSKAFIRLSNSAFIRFQLSCIRRSGAMDRIFYMEVGRSAIAGGGELWMEVEDNNIAQNMHHAINNAMTNSSTVKDDGPRQRMRSSSANEASKPISVLQRRHTAQKLHGFSPLGVPAVRDRCDSLPSRARTSSEGQPSCCVVSAAAAAATGGRASHLMIRPHSVHTRAGMMMSYSPPVGSMPISPASGACSTDSAGSSLSIDDASENMDEGVLAKFGHSLTPDEPVILEENADDYVPWSHSVNHQPKYHCSPSQQSSYVEMYSPCSSSPGRGAYMPMSPAQGAHSRSSSLVEEASLLGDGYVPMAPLGDDGYVDMDPVNNHNGHFPDDMSQHGGSSCSVTSGTPSTDMRFSEYHLDKVTSFLAPGEDFQTRPTRAYSVGSRPEPINRHRKNRLDIAQQESNRVRAFSVGSRSKRPEIARLTHVITAPLVPGIESSHSNKSNSAPMLSSSWGHTSVCSTTSERMEDLMELDFTRPAPVAALTSPPSSYSHSHSQSQSQSYSTATDTSSYVDMSPGQPPISSTAPYLDMNGPAKNNRINNNSSSSSNNNINNNNNNNNNFTTANHNHNHSLLMVSAHKPVITQVTPSLKPVEEAESSYMRMAPSLEDWQHSRLNPKQVPSPCQDDYMQMNGPPGGTRTAPMDLPQPRRPPEGYVEMSFKPKPSLEQDYINMSLGLNRNNRRQHHNNNRKKKSSLPIAIQAGSKFSKAPNFLPLNGSPTSESLDSTPASPPRATPTGSSATIFPFSLNSPQSPIKQFSSFTASSSSQQTAKSPSSLGDNASIKSDSDAALPITRKISAPSPLPGVDGCPSSKKAHDNPDSHTNPTTRHVTPSSKLSNTVNSIISTIATKEPLRAISNSIAQEQAHPLSPITKKLSDLTVSKPRLVTASPTTSPTPSGFKPVQLPKPTSPKVVDDCSPTPSSTPTPTPTSTPTPSPLDSEGYEKLQPGATLLHYASLDLPDVSGAPPVSPTPVQEGFNYAEIDFAKLKQN
ncbi:insulin receptor substrate 1-like isoform X2 [Phymastichus coffea]|uniref:insulin receptor substrate 1-like isoform X2 n=1 Tax=Phymastichus coffea TaxID=108790 RepID=UPI00273BD28B|nr:insulin receptor substrate 1-like isoform X2 [Phymastichus coffea]